MNGQQIVFSEPGPKLSQHGRRCKEIEAIASCVLLGLPWSTAKNQNRTMLFFVTYCSHLGCIERYDLVSHQLAFRLIFTRNCLCGLVLQGGPPHKTKQGLACRENWHLPPLPPNSSLREIHPLILFHDFVVLLGSILSTSYSSQIEFY